MEMEEERRKAKLREMEAKIRADERERIAKKLESIRGDGDIELRDGLNRAIRLLLIAEKPKTREQVLEEALREAPCTCGVVDPALIHHLDCYRWMKARRALEWKP